MMFFMKVEFHSDFINRVAKHVFAVYLFEGALRQIVQNIVFDYSIYEGDTVAICDIGRNRMSESSAEVRLQVVHPVPAFFVFQKIFLKLYSKMPLRIPISIGTSQK